MALFNNNFFKPFKNNPLVRSLFNIYDYYKGNIPPITTNNILTEEPKVLQTEGGLNFITEAG